MAKSRPSGRPTRNVLSIGDARADILADALRSAVQTKPLRREDIARVPRVAGWTAAILDDAIDRLVARGMLLESPTDDLIVLPGTPEAA